MKKALLVLLVLVAIGSFAFADVTVSGYIATGFKVDYLMNAPTGVAKDSIYPFETEYGTPYIGLVNFAFADKDAMFGADTRVLVVGSTVPAMDHLQVWTKLFDGMLTAYVGNTLANSSYQTAEMEWGHGNWEVPGAQLIAKPMEGLEVAYLLPWTVGGDIIGHSFGASKIGASYTMKDVFSVNGAVLLSNVDKGTDAYFGISVNAVKDLGLWIEGLMVDLGDTTTGETDIYVEGNYNLGMLSVGLAGEYNIVANTALKSGWVVGPYAVLPVEKWNLIPGFDFGTANFGGPGVATGLGGAAVALDGFQWDAYVKADYATPFGKFRVQAGYVEPNTKVDNNEKIYALVNYRWAL